MKNINILVYLLLMCYSTCAYSQKKEVNYQDNTYIYDTESKRIKNKKNHIKIESICYDFYVEGTLSYNIIPDIFTQKELKQLAENKKRIIVYVVCNSNGVVLEVDFVLGKWDKELSNIDMKRINALEKFIIGQKIKIINPCPDIKYYRISHAIIFEEYL